MAIVRQVKVEAKIKAKTQIERDRPISIKDAIREMQASLIKIGEKKNLIPQIINENPTILNKKMEVSF